MIRESDNTYIDKSVTGQGNKVNGSKAQNKEEFQGGRWRLSLHVMLKDYPLGRIGE